MPPFCQQSRSTSPPAGHNVNRFGPNDFKRGGGNSSLSVCQISHVLSYYSEWLNRTQKERVICDNSTLFLSPVNISLVAVQNIQDGSTFCGKLSQPTMWRWSPLLSGGDTSGMSGRWGWQLPQCDHTRDSCLVRITLKDSESETLKQVAAWCHHQKLCVSRGMCAGLKSAWMAAIRCTVWRHCVQRCSRNLETNGSTDAEDIPVQVPVLQCKNNDISFFTVISGISSQGSFEGPSLCSQTCFTSKQMGPFRLWCVSLLCPLRSPNITAPLQANPWNHIDRITR